LSLKATLSVAQPLRHPYPDPVSDTIALARHHAATGSIPLHQPGDTDTHHRHATLLYILVFCLAWWGIYLLGRHGLDGRDMVEAYAWGQEWQWGTNKHPPMSGWVVAAWFTLMPATEAMFYLLNQVNLALALGLLALAMRTCLRWDQILLAIVLTSLGTHFGPDQGFKYNANTAMLPFIAGFTWSLLRGLSDTRLRWFVAAGVFAAAALLSKYFALVLIATIGIGVASTVRPPWGTLCKATCISGLTAAILCAPHVWWSVQHGWPSLHYMRSSHLADRSGPDLTAYAVMIGDYIHFSGLALVVWALSLWRARKPAAWEPARPAALGLAVLGLCLGLTLLAAWLQNMVPVSAWLIPAFLFVGWAMVDLTPASVNTGIVARRSCVAALCYLLVAGAAAAIIGQQYRRQSAGTPDGLAPVLARDVAAAYRQAYGQGIAYVAGSFPLPYNIAFYSPEHPHALAGLELAQSPWIDAQALHQGNHVVVCGTLTFTPAQDPGCADAGRKLLGTPDQIRQLSYAVHDPKSGQDGQQIYQLLMWKPAAR
jgi:hypothetical protein